MTKSHAVNVPSVEWIRDDSSSSSFIIELLLKELMQRFRRGKVEKRICCPQPFSNSLKEGQSESIHTRHDD